jgi:hypothetical protein
VNTKFKFASIIVAAMVAIPVLSGCSQVSTTPGEVAVHYEDNPIIPTSKSYLDCFGPSHQEFTGVGDDFYYYPAGERTYKFSLDEGADGAPVKIVKNNVTLLISGVATFSLNPDCKTLQTFHEKIGLKQWNGHYAYIEGDNYDGWNAMLDVYIEQAIQSAASASASNDKTSTYLDIYNGTGRGNFETDMSKQLPVFAQQLSGGNFFINFRLTVNKPILESAALKDSLTGREIAKAENDAQLQRNATVNTELDSIKAIVAVLGQAGYIDYQKNKLTEKQLDLLSQAIAKGNITVLPVPQGSNVTIPAPVAK